MTTTLATIQPENVNDLSRAIARASLSKTAQMVDANAFRNAAKVMGRQLADATETRLSALNAVWSKDLPENVLEWLNELGNAICA